jgi:hypothetical protein
MNANISNQITKFSNTQNRIESKDFAALDPNQERLSMDFAVLGLRYIYRTGAKLDDEKLQFAIDEAIVCQACNLDDVTYTAMAKSNVGKLTDDISKAPYTLLFTKDTNATLLRNHILILRVLEKYLKEKRNTTQGRERLVITHGNRFILHLLLIGVKREDAYKTDLIDCNEIERYVHAKTDRFLITLTSIVNNDLGDSYPAYIFKNSNKCRIIESKMKEVEV